MARFETGERRCHGVMPSGVIVGNVVVTAIIMLLAIVVVTKPLTANSETDRT